VNMGLPLKIKNLSVTIGRGAGRGVLDSIDLTIRPGEFVAIIGPNGAGKTTLLRAVSGLIPVKGTIEIGDSLPHQTASSAHGRLISYLAQGGRIHWPIPVQDVVALGRLPYRATGGPLNDIDRVAVAEAMQTCNIAHLATRPATQLSGGERARVLLARALAVQAPILLTDEPVASLDPAQQLAMMSLLQKQARRGRTIVTVLHDLSLAANFCDRLIALGDGRVVADGTPENILHSGALDRLFGVRLLQTRIEGRLLVGPTA
jgi:iron complex transport system ATP-binding protein